MKLRNKFLRFMYGRNGMDFCNQILAIIYFSIIFISIFAKDLTTAYILIGVAYIFFFLFIYRALSKDLVKRRKENEYCYKIRANATKEFRLLKNRWKDRKTHFYKKCPNCKSVLRLRRTKGHHNCNCPHCGTKIEVNVRIAKSTTQKT